MTRFDGPKRLSEHQRVQRLARKLEQLHFELAVEAPRRTLDYLFEHAEDLLGSLENTEQKKSLAAQLSRARVLISRRGNLRVVSSVTTPTGGKNWSDYPKVMAERLSRCQPLPGRELPGACSHDEGNEAS